MALMKIRRQGRSLAVTLDAATLEAANLREGDLVQPTIENGKIVLTPVALAPGVPPRVLEAIDRAVKQNERVLKRLAEYDSK